mgnify:FL=1
MTDRELQKLKRVELLQLLVEQSRELDALRQELAQARRELEARELRLQEAGSIAEASMQLNGVFEAAQRAADQYLESIRYQSEHMEEKCAAMEEATRLRCDQMLKEAEASVQQAQKDSDECWRDVKGKLEDYLRQQTALQGLLSRTLGEETK